MVIFVVIVGVIVGLMVLLIGKSFMVFGMVFVNLIKMMIVLVIFCMIVFGIGLVCKVVVVGKVGGLVLVYFLMMLLVVFGIGLIVGNLFSLGRDLYFRFGVVGSGVVLVG